MPKGEVRLTVSRQLDKWIDGMDDFDRDFERNLSEEWKTVTDVMFDRSQAHAHIISGTMKASGESGRPRREGSKVVSDITYHAPYAVYEHNRGGDHAYLTLAAMQTEDEFPEAITAAFEKTVEGWR